MGTKPSFHAPPLVTTWSSSPGPRAPCAAHRKCQRLGVPPRKHSNNTRGMTNIAPFVNRTSAERECCFIGTQFCHLYTSVYPPTQGRVVVCLVFVIACKYARRLSQVSQPLNLLLIMPPLTLWLSHFASCLPSLQQTPVQLAQAPPPLHLRPPSTSLRLLLCTSTVTT